MDSMRGTLRKLYSENTMLKVHHLNHSRSQRIVWLLEELELPYEIIPHQRDLETRQAPASLKEIHPLGKSPVLVDDDQVVAESGAIIDYLTRVSKPGALRPQESSSDYNQYVFWMHYAEGSAMLPLLLALYVGSLGDAGAPLSDRISAEINSNLDFMSAELGDDQFFVGNTFSGADVQLTFVLEAAASRGLFDHRKNLQAYVSRMQSRAAYKRAIERGGPYHLGS
ncbi:MAG: glutathione S-transferase [Oceanicoccus sp.]|jgi:glutathione S-transferase